MNLFETPGLAEQNPEKEVFQERLEELLKSGASLLEIVQILGAERYLNKEGKEGHHFDVKAFVDDQFKQGTALELPAKFLKLKETILPPGEGEIVTGSGKGIEEKDSVPRTNEFISLLTELQEPYFLISGTNADNMIRTDTYRIFLLPNLEKLVFVNDEESNATFVVHNAIEGSWRQYAQMTKDQLKELSQNEVQTIIYLGSLEEWKIKMKTTLYAILEKKESESEDSKEEIEFAPSGWITNFAFSIGINKDRWTTNKIANSFREDHPDWFRRYKNSQGKIFEHYSPLLIEIIKEKIEEIPIKAPEGWMTNYEIASEFDKKNSPLLPKIANSFREDHPDWFRRYSHRRGVAEYYHPELIAKIREQIRSRPGKPPQDWMTSASLATEYGVNPSTVAKKASRYRETNPEWFKIYLNKARWSSDHYHPDLVAKIKDELVKN